jgi:hypothetical protein
MHKTLARLALIASLVLAPVALRADSMTGQFSIQGTVTNTGSVLMFEPGTLMTGSGTQTGTFATLLSNNELITGGTPNIPYNPYTPDSGFFTIGPLTVTLETLLEMTVGPIQGFSGVADLTAAGFTDTLADYSFSTQSSGAVTFSATVIAEPPPSVPEPSSLALFGTGIFGIAGFCARKLNRVSL